MRGVFLWRGSENNISGVALSLYVVIYTKEKTLKAVMEFHIFSFKNRLITIDKLPIKI